MNLKFLPILLVLVVTLTSCDNNINNNTSSNKVNIDSLHQVLKTHQTAEYYEHNGYDIFAETQGDIDNDNIDERIVIYKNKDDYMFYLVVFKNINNNWYVWFKNNKRSFTAVKEFIVKNGRLIFTFTAPHNIITDEYTLVNNEFVLSALRIDSKFNCSVMQLDYNLLTEDFYHLMSSGCKSPRRVTENGKKKKEEHITFENRRFLGHVWRTPKGQLLEF